MIFEYIKNRINNIFEEDLTYCTYSICCELCLLMNMLCDMMMDENLKKYHIEIKSIIEDEDMLIKQFEMLESVAND